MASRLGIIPAAGKAERFGGVRKELLPLGNGRIMLHETIDRLPVNKVVVITSHESKPLHDYYVKNLAYTRVRFGSRGMWDDWMCGMFSAYDQYYFSMPDTHMPKDSYVKARDVLQNSDADIVFLTFQTKEPERFGSFRDGDIVDKEPSGTEETCWAGVVYTWDVADFWLGSDYDDYTEALNGAIDNFKFRFCPIDYYYDISDFDRYLELLKVLHD